MLALLLGAGFSKWAAGLPLGSELFDFALEPSGTREQHRLHRVRELKRNWDALNPDGLAEQFIASVLCCDDARSKEDVLWYVVRPALRTLYLARVACWSHETTRSHD